MKAPAFKLPPMPVRDVVAELRRRATTADTACLAGLSALLLAAALSH